MKIFPSQWFPRLAACLIAGASLLACDTDPAGIPGAQLRIIPDSLILSSIGETGQLGAQLNLSDGTPASASVGWRSLAPAVATVDPTGLATAIGPGSAVIEADAAGARAQTVVVVRPAVAALEIRDAPAAVVAGDTVRLRAIARDARGTILSANVVRWQSSEEFAPVDSTGMVHVRTAGAIRIIASANGVADTAAFLSTVRYSSVTSGNRHSCAITTQGDPYCWGYPASFALGSGGSAGDGPLLAHTSFGVVRMKQVSAAGHSCGVAEDDRGYCWGAGAAIGTGGISAKHAMRLDSTLFFRSIATGGSHSCGVMRDGTVRCWGFANRGQIGRDTFVIHFPRTVESNVGFTAVTAGDEHTCALGSDQHAYCWGANDVGQLGIGSADSMSHPSPTRIAGEHRFTALSAGGSHTCGIDTMNQLYCWGNNRVAQLTAGIAADQCGVVGGKWNCALAPMRVPLTGAVTRVSAGLDHTCALVGTAAYCWGNNVAGKAGDGSAAVVTSPLQLAGSWSAIAAGGSHTCGIRDALLVCWGDNGFAQLGTAVRGGGSFEPRPIVFQ